ncbi:MAG: 4-hydroxy-tetrahydrodipicolinate reductase [Pseudomonadota bacterium]
MTQVSSLPSNPALHAVAVAGASGRMGHMLIEAISQSDDCRLSGALDLPNSAAVGTDASASMGIASGVLVTADLKAGLQNSHYLIDFTRPEGTLAHLKVCQALGVKAVIGTTGFSDAEKAEIKAISKDIAIVMAPNMSVGVNVTLKLLEMAAKAMATGYDIEIIEAHHRHKVDAPLPTPWAATSKTARFMHAKASRASAILPALALPRSAAATLWAITPSCLPAQASE